MTLMLPASKVSEGLPEALAMTTTLSRGPARTTYPELTHPIGVEVCGMIVPDSTYVLLPTRAMVTSPEKNPEVVMLLFTTNPVDIAFCDPAAVLTAPTYPVMVVLPLPVRAC